MKFKIINRTNLALYCKLKFPLQSIKFRRETNEFGSEAEGVAADES